MIQTKKALEFVSENGEELARHIFFNVHNVIVGFSDYFQDILKNASPNKQLPDEDHGFLALLTTFISIRVELEMQAIYEKYGDDVYSRLGEHVSSYYESFLINYTENVEEMAIFLMHSAHETVMNNEGEDVERILALQFKNIAAADEDFTPDIFQPFMPALLEGGDVVGIIEDNI